MQVTYEHSIYPLLIYDRVSVWGGEGNKTLQKNPKLFLVGSFLVVVWERQL